MKMSEPQPMEKCYLLHISLGGKPSDARLAEAARDIKALVNELSPDHFPAYTSRNGFGLLLKSTLRAGQVAHGINSPGGEGGKLIPAPLRRGESLLVLEVGPDVADVDMNAVKTWVQNHHPITNRASKVQAASGQATTQGQLAEKLAKLKGKFDK